MLGKEVLGLETSQTMGIVIDDKNPMT